MISAKEAHELYEKSLPDEEIQYHRLESIETIIKERCKNLSRFLLVDDVYINDKTQNYLSILGYNLIFVKEKYRRYLRISW